MLHPDQYYKDLGICPRCHKNSPVSGKSRCQDCLDYGAAEGRRKRAARRSLILCDECSEVPARPRSKVCASCASQKTYYQRWVGQRSRNGKCQCCNMPIDDTKFVHCSSCRKKMVEKNKVDYWKSVSNNLCPDCHNPHDLESPSSRLCSKCYQNSRSRRITSHSKKNFSGILETIIERDKACVICGIPYVGGNKKVVCHHIDSDRSNNNPDNLMLLCRRCHSLMTNWISCPNKPKMLDFLLQHYPAY